MHLSEGAEISNENDTIMKSRGPMDIMLDDIHKPRIRPEGRIYRDRSWRGTGVADLFGDMTIEGISKNIYSSKPKKKSKNFMEENKKTVKELNTTLQSLKLNLTPNSVPKRPPTPEKYKNVESKVGQLIRSTSQQNLSKNERSKSALNLHTSKDTPKSSRIPVPDRPVTAIANSEHRKDKIKSDRQSARRPRSASYDKAKNVIKEMQIHKPGTVPKYLIDRKIAWQQDNKKPEEPECPAGHRLVGNSEKQETLQLLKTAEAEILSTLNTLPIRTDTPFLKRKKAELEGKLMEVEEAQRIFSRTKVFVKAD